MTRLKAVLGYTAAMLALLVALATFFGMGYWSRQLVAVTGLDISPWFSGGEVASTISREGYQTDIHRPVFQALVGERKKGFVQVAWKPAGALPATIDETVDFDGDGRKDFRVTLDTGTGRASLEPLSPYVLSLEGPYNIKDAIAVRVKLRNPAK